MSRFKALFNFYINSSIHVALSVCALTWITLLEFGIPWDALLIGFIFFASITGYNFVKYFGLARFHHRSLAHWLKVIQVFSLLSFLAMIYFGLKLKEMTWLYIVGFGIVTFLYAIPFLPRKFLFDHQQNLRNVGGVKVYIIGLTWAGVTVILPLVNNDFQLNSDALITLVQRFLFVLALMLPFEIRDLNYDSLKLATIPQQIGIKNTKMVGVILMLLFVILELFKASVTCHFLTAVCFIALVTLAFIWASKKEQFEYYCSFWVEGIPVLWLALVLLLEFF
ncbi:hypothetical protein [Mangrovimonas futianensis]|uniref:hypothetical protein n=1 Tax=Mangrovimonas futianensis TaxID=2895523 RepID=UPI001E427705|nr:hypothetical protein [Mangrovimonas futianensis]MCF1420134.1 hypothetical protein [Mangrovimonas futianensis]